MSATLARKTGLLTLLACLVFLQGQLFAQPPVDIPDAVRRLDRDIERFERLAQMAPSAKLEERLAQVRRLRTEAMLDYRAGRKQAAAQKLNRARRMLDELRAQIVRGPVQNYVDRYRDLLRRVEGQAAQLGDKEVDRLLNQARNRGREAEKLARQGDFPGAAEAYRSAIFLLETALKRTQRGTRLRERIQAAEDRYRALVDRLRAQPPTPMGQKLLGEAQKHASKAKQAAAKAQWQVAMDHYNSALRLVYRALEARSPNVERQLHELDRLIEQRAEALRGERGASLLLERVKRLRQEAWRDLRQGRPGQAVRKIEISRRLLERVSLGARKGREGRLQDLRRELDELRQLVSTLGTNAAASDVLNAVQFLLNSVEQDLNADRLGPASRKLLLCYRLIGQAQVGRGAGEPQSLTGMREKLENLQGRFDSMRQKNPTDPIWNVVQDLLSKAERALKRGDVRRAHRLMKAASSMLALAEEKGP